MGTLPGKGTTTISTKKDVAESVALIFGVTGLVGKEIANNLLAKSGWKVYGIARKPDFFTPIQHRNYRFISCDLLDPVQTVQKLSSLNGATHIFWVTWASQFPLDSSECCDQNKAMMSNALDAILPKAKALKHVSLQTGTKHYVSLSGPFDNTVRRYDEESPRVNEGHNFYYMLEDLLIEKLRGKVSWSVHRPGLILGSSHRTAFNFIGSLCIYGTICKHLHLPFVFGGARECWEEVYIDGSDARLVAEQHIWVSTNDNVSSTDGQAFNAVNGPSFTWKQIWPALAVKFGLQAAEDMFSQDFLFSTSMADKESVWEDIVVKEGLRPTKIGDLANWTFLDVLFRFPTKLLAARDKVDRLGFTMTYEMLDSILYWVDCIRDEKLIP
ncbi:PREDICTED: 3-oxo-Delta(4,5)-steroid 5-beta-reductase isoform X2 [Nelumbo nucifera]|uniref:3-oxo-Delta(4,5)-steroid 5-beta-reductase isoform X2 n=2 Tax=Nelumbo nucifera TaxID=4432 RepID=A0A1U8AXK6_NELNU|nr:PREDICTED: 3-oxo-Delta(4,5)-steroid 5-beta-reductase isoform X2 [Nelumbo nucifera]DAD39597.1 TPA_asm: hypothetical protein HUJ06_013920 [Nelumbo nucifera]